MTLPPVTLAQRALSFNATITPDRRRYKRVALSIAGRFMRENKLEYPCRLKDISVGGAAILSPVTVALNERIIAQFDHLGGLEGKVVRLFNDGFAVEFTATSRKREKLAALLTWLINRSELDTSEERRHERVVPEHDEATLHLAEGIAIAVKVLDLSISGASIATQARPPIGMEIRLGKLRARVMRHHSQGIGLQFLDTQDLNTVSDHFK